MTNIFARLSPHTPVLVRGNRLTRIWIETGRKTQPLACVWIDADACSRGDQNPSDADPVELCLCA